MHMFIMGILKLLKSQTLKKVNILQNLPNSNGIYPIGVANQNIILLCIRICINVHQIGENAHKQSIELLI
jgi:hypothetical protein